MTPRLLLPLIALLAAPVPSLAHDLPSDVLQRFVAVIRDAGCSMSVGDLDRGPVSALFTVDEVWHAVSQLLNEGRARIDGGRTFILTEEECA